MQAPTSDLYPYAVTIILPPRTPRTANWIANILGKMRRAATQFAPDAYEWVNLGHDRHVIRVANKLTAMRLGIVNQHAMSDPAGVV